MAASEQPPEQPTEVHQTPPAPPESQPTQESPAYEPPPEETQARWAEPTTPAAEPQAPAVTSEAPPQTEADRQEAAEQVHKDARPQTDENIPDNIWDQTRQGEEPYKWHSGTQAPARLHRRDRVHRRQEVVRPQHDPQRPEPGRPGRPDLDDPGPVGHGQVGVHQAHGRPALPRRGRRPGPRRVGAEHAGRRAVRDAQEVRRPVPGRRALRLDEPVRQRRVPAAPAHRQGRGGDQRDLLAPAPRGRPLGRGRQDAERALGRHAQARRLRPRACARPRDRALRRAGLGPRPGPHRAPVRAHQGDPRRRTAAPTSSSPTTS